MYSTLNELVSRVDRVQNNIVIVTMPLILTGTDCVDLTLPLDSRHNVRWTVILNNSTVEIDNNTEDIHNNSGH